MNKTTIWLNTLFNNFIKNSNVKIYFEEKDKLKEKDKVLNFSIHPLRFTDDIFFNIETNDEKIREKLKKYEVNYNMFYYYADLVKATYLKNVKKEIYKENSLLIIGQTEKDKVVFDGNKYLSLLDFMDDLKIISERYDNLYFKPHPYAKNNKYIFKELKKSIGNLQITHDNIYHLLSSENIKGVVGLNSSVLYEAKYFLKKVTFLHKPYFDLSNTDIGIYGNYFNSSFWADILQIKDVEISLPFTSNRLRKSINDFWGYNEISDEIILKDIIKSKIKYILSKYVR